MALIKTIRGKTPEFGKNTWLADNATITGDVRMGKNCSVWFQSVIRGDVNSIRIGDWVNIQDGAVLHCTFEKADLQIGNHVSIGHRAIVHGCDVADEVLIGMGAIVMDHAKIPSHVVIGAGSTVLEGMELESGFIYAGTPARKIKEMEEEQLQYLIERTAKNYHEYSNWYND
jgi:carbonic anhydrase/acetyltransferase-like protein (isoleucine patch superfamily)